MAQESIYDINEEVRKRFQQNLPEQEQMNQGLKSSSYQTFKQEQKEEFYLNSFYEKYCGMAVSFFGFIPVLGNKEVMKKEIEIAGLNVTPKAVSASILLTFTLALITAIPFVILGWTNLAFFFIASGMFLAYVSFTYPGFSSEIIKIIAQQESILAILYMTIYMRVNPILENALYFSVQHLSGPLGKDLKQCLWLLDNERVGSIEEAIQYFVPLWVDRNPDFVRSLLTLYTVLEQTDKENQIRILDKSLDMILNSTYEKMKHYSHDLQMPVMVLHTFGMMLPLIGLIAFPMISVFMNESIKISHLFFGYIVVLPLLLFFYTRRIIAKRPGAFSFPDISHNPTLPPEGMYRIKFRGENYLLPALTVSIIVGFFLILPGIYHVTFATIPAYLANKDENLVSGTIPPSLAKEYDMDSIFSTLFLPFGVGIGIALYFYMRSIQRLKIRQEVIEIEDDLGGALFQLGNQFTENIPIEEAVQRFIDEYILLNMKKKAIYQFFSLVMDRIQDEGVTFSDAIFDFRRGVILRYPSVLLKEVSWIITEGAKKGAKVTYNILNKISIYLDNVRKIKELIYDLLTETVSSINMQAKFLAPFIAAIVGSLTQVIIKALYQMFQKLDAIMNSLNFGSSPISGSDNFFQEFINFSQVTPPTVFQILVGTYMVQTVILLSILANGVENGFDNVSRDVTLARNLFFAMIVYSIVTVLGIYSLNNLIAVAPID